MRFIVDELPSYESDCPFYDLEAMACKLDGKERDICGNPGMDCPHLMALPSDKCDLCVNYMTIGMIRPDYGSFKENRRKLVGGYPNG